MQFPEPSLTREFLSGFAETWRLWVPLLLLLIWVGWITRRWWGGRLLLLSLGVLITFAATITLREEARERVTLEAWNNLRVPLPHVARIDGLQLAAGTMVRWNQESQGHLLTAEFGNGQEVSHGVVLVGEADHRSYEFWRGTLVSESILRGWNCAAGKIDLHTSGNCAGALWLARRRLRRVKSQQVPQSCSIPVTRVTRSFTCQMLGCRRTLGISGLRPTNGLSCIQTGNSCRCRARSLDAASDSIRASRCAMEMKTSHVGMVTLTRFRRRLHVQPGQSQGGGETLALR